MATHYVRHHGIHRPLAVVIEIVACWLTAWIEFWSRTDPQQPAHETGATREFAADLHAWNDTDSEAARFRELLAASVICGTELAELTTVDGWQLTGTLVAD